MDTQDKNMTKHEFLDKIAKRLDTTPLEADRSLKAILTTLTEVFTHKDSLALVGFGSFGSKERAARTGRHPKTGEPLAIPATTVAYFKPSAVLKADLNPTIS